MDNNKKINFICINHKNRLDYFNEEKLVEFKLNLYTKLANMQEKDFSQNLNIFMEKFLFFDNKSDQFELNLMLSKKFYDNYPNIKFDCKCPEMIFIIDKILNQNFNMEFKCNEIFVSFISRILFFCFMEIKNNYNKFYSNIKNYDDFKKKINEVLYENINLRDYIVISKDEGSSQFKGLKNTGKIVKSFRNLDNLEINLNSYEIINFEREEKENKNKISNKDKIINEKEKKYEEEKKFNNLNSKSLNLNSVSNLILNIENNINNNNNLTERNQIKMPSISLNYNNTNLLLNNIDSKKSSFSSNNDSNDTTTKKSTFSSNNNGNNFDHSLITPFNKFTKDNLNNEEKLEIGDLKLVENQITSPSKDYLREKNLIISGINISNNQDDIKNVKINTTKDKIFNKNIEEESFLCPIILKRRSCKEIKIEIVKKTFEEEISHNKNIIIEKKVKATEENTKKENNNDINIKKKNNDKSAKKSFFENFFNRERHKSCNDTSNSKNVTKINNIKFNNPSEFFKTNFPNILNSSKCIYLEYKNEKEFNSHGLPIFLILLVQKLMFIKKLTITIPNNSKNNNNLIENYIIILQNLDWLFQNLLEIEIDFGIGCKRTFDEFFKIKPNKKNEISNFANGFSYGSKFTALVEEYKTSFELLILICNLCSKFTNLYILCLNNYSCYYLELDYFTKTYYKEIQFIHILDLFNNFTNLVELKFNFNALDSFTFERIINIIHINNNLKCINLDFRIDGEDFSIDSLKRIYLKHYLFSNSNYLYNHVGRIIDKPNFSKNSFENSNSNEIENNYNSSPYSYLQNLYKSGFSFLRKNSKDKNDIDKTDNKFNYKSFCSNNNYYDNVSRNFCNFSLGNSNILHENMNNNKTKCFPDVINDNHNRNNSDLSNQINQSNTDLQSLKNFLSPEENNENKFINLIMRKFEPLLEELFFIVESKKNLMELNFMINLPSIISSNENFIMTLQKLIFNIFKSYDSLDSNLKTLSIKSPYFSFNNRKYPVIEKFINTIDLQKNNISINNFTLDVQLNKIPNLINLIPKNVQFLSLGEFDIETFIFLKKSFIEKNSFFLNSQLNCLTLSFSRSILDKTILVNEFNYLYACLKPKNLKEIQILTNLIVDKNSLKEILIPIKADNIDKYYFEFNKQSLEYFVYFRSNLQKINLVNDKDNQEEKKLNYFFNLMSKYKTNIDINITRKIVYNIVIYIKEIYITNIEIKFRD